MSCLRSWLKVALVAIAAVALLACHGMVRHGLLERLDDATLRDFRLVFDSVGTDVADDAGDTSFVRQAVPIVLGRKVRGYDELQLFVGLVQATDRPRFVRMLTDRTSPYYTEYVEHWSNFFVAARHPIGACGRLSALPDQTGQCGRTDGGAGHGAQWREQTARTRRALKPRQGSARTARG